MPLWPTRSVPGPRPCSGPCTLYLQRFSLAPRRTGPVYSGRARVLAVLPAADGSGERAARPVAWDRGSLSTDVRESDMPYPLLNAAGHVSPPSRISYISALGPPSCPAPGVHILQGPSPKEQSTRSSRAAAEGRRGPVVRARKPAVGLPRRPLSVRPNSGSMQATASALSRRRPPPPSSWMPRLGPARGAASASMRSRKPRQSR